MKRAHADRLALARVSLLGLSVGDALGEALSYQHHRCRSLCDFSSMREGSLRYTDDTSMALVIYQTLERLGAIDEEVLAWAFASQYRKDPERGYGKMARHILKQIADGAAWLDVSKNAFGGGSFGNGASMRAAPLGAYYADDIPQASAMALRSARVTHFHQEGTAGAIAVAIAAAVATQQKEHPAKHVIEQIWQQVLHHTPQSRVRQLIEIAYAIRHLTANDAARELGNGAEISAQDTVPFCIWNACQNLTNFREAILSTIEVGGDCDTNCAIVGGIVAAYTGTENIPQDWLRVCEAL